MTNKTNLFILAMMMIYSGLIAQTTLVLQPDATAGKDAFLVSGSQGSNNYGNHEEVTSAYWTVQGQWTAVRSLLQFDLSQIPSNAIITDAKISLWCHNTTQSTTQLHSGDNESVLIRVTSAWDENTVNWNNQPASTFQNQVLLPASTSNTQDYLHMTATALFQDIVSSGNNYGLMLRLLNEYDYQSLVFASSDHPNPAKRPKLEITYVVLQTSCITLQPDATVGKDAFLVSGSQGSNNYGTHEEVTSAYWTVQGQWTAVRSLLQFDLSQIPSNAIITDAKISLWCNNTTQSTLQLHSGDNESVLIRVTSAWDENTVNWNNQPASTFQNQVLLPASTSNTQDYLNMTATTLFQDIVSSGNNYGLMLRLVNEYDYQSLVFASSDHTNPAKRPKLEICYGVPSSIHDVQVESNNLMVFPNPANGLVTISFVQSISLLPKEVKVFNMLGEEAGSYVLAQGVSNLQINTSEFSKGAYIVKATDGEKSYTKRLIVQ